MAALGPRELDVGWFVFLHRFFQDIAEFFEQPGLPDFLRRSDVERYYQELTGWPLRDIRSMATDGPASGTAPGASGRSANPSRPAGPPPKGPCRDSGGSTRRSSSVRAR